MKRGFVIVVAPSRKERGPGIAWQFCAREVEARRVARGHIGPETGSMQCTCINSLHNVSGELQS